MSRLVGGAVGAGLGMAAAAHLGPAVTWLPAVRRHLAPGLDGQGCPGHIALTFDDGPDPASTPAFLQALDKLGWRATFFMLGSMARRAPSLAQEVAGAGHEVALHGDQHRNHLGRPLWAVNDDLARGRDSVAQASGREPLWHRPPYGVVSGGTMLAARRLGLEVVLWGAWGRDWRARATPATVMTDVMRGLSSRPGSVGGLRSRPGSTLLLHDSDSTSAPGAWRSALGALPLLAEQFAQEGWEVGPLSDHGITARGQPSRLSAGDAARPGAPAPTR